LAGVSEAGQAEGGSASLGSASLGSASLGSASLGSASQGGAEGGTHLDRRLVAVMAVATGLTVANNYYAQPLLPAMAKSLGMSSATAGLIVTFAQGGYAVGLLFLLPLGDLVERRRLVVILSVATAAGLLCLGSAPSTLWLLPAAFAVGAVSVLAQVLVPFAASLAGEHERGRVVGMVMSGLLVGILLARTVAGWLAETGSWRVVYYVAATAMLAQAALLAWRLPTWRLRAELPYHRLVASVATLLGQEPVLRLRASFGFISFGTFSVLWTSLAFLLSRNYHYSPGVIGMFGLVGAAGAGAASVAGRLADRGWQWRNTGVCTGLLIVSWAALWAGARSIAALVIGLLVFDFAAQGLHITNQSEIYRLRPEARSRLNAAYMFLYFLGGATGSALSATLYGTMGWKGPCLAGAAFAAVGFILWAGATLLSVPHSDRQAAEVS
jgi:predicted MFS family arabinose efflux permease